MVETAFAPHVVLASTSAWSHFRAMCVFAAKLVAERPIVVTVIVPHWSTTFEKVNGETSRCLRDTANPCGRLRIVGLGQHSTARDPLEIFNVGNDSLEPFWQAIASGLPVKCFATGKQYEAAAKPVLVILDGFLCGWHPVIRSYSPSVPIFSWASGAASGYIYICLPGGHYIDGSLESKPAEISGRIVHVANLPPMYDWELVPQQPAPFEQDLIALLRRSLYESDGIITSCALGYDGEAALSALSNWAAGKNYPTFHVGPLLPFKQGTTEFSKATLDAELAIAPEGVADAIQSFLDAQFDAKGESSVVYICFGTLFWPSNTGHLWALLNALAERDIPFILSHSGLGATIPSEVANRYADGMKGLLVPWSPQQTVMTHKAIGWFVTHGGAGSTMDALTQGVPMVGWPFVGDQPTNVAYLTHTADVAFELLEVRTGELGLKPTLASGRAPTGTLEAFKKELAAVLDDMAGEAGVRKRVNARKRQAKLARAWTSEGPARKAFNEFVERYGL